MLLTSTVDFKDELEKVMFDHINDEVSSSSSEMAIQPDNEVAVAEKNTTKKARKEDSKKKREAKIAAVNQMAAKIFSKQAAECVKCKTLTKDLCGIKGELEKREKQLEDTERDVQLKEKRLSESQEKLADLQSSLKAKKRVIDNLEKEKVEQVKRIKSGELNRKRDLYVAIDAYFHVDFPSITMSSIRFLENLANYYRSSPDDINSDESSDEVHG